MEPSHDDLRELPAWSLPADAAEAAGALVETRLSRALAGLVG